MLSTTGKSTCTNDIISPTPPCHEAHSKSAKPALLKHWISLDTFNLALQHQRGNFVFVLGSHLVNDVNNDDLVFYEKSSQNINYHTNYSRMASNSQLTNQK